MNKKCFLAMALMLILFIYGCGSKTPEVTGATVRETPYNVVVLSDESIKKGVELANSEIGFVIYYGECGSLSSLVEDYDAIGVIGSCPDEELAVPIISINANEDVFVPESIIGKQFEVKYRKNYNEDPTEKSAEAFEAVLKLSLALENSDGSAQGLIDAIEEIDLKGPS